MAKVTIDSSACVGCGLCEQACPEVFKVEGDGIAHVKADSCSTHDIKDISGQCPVEAIKIK